MLYTKSIANDIEDEEEAIVREYKRYVLEEKKPKESDTHQMKLNYQDMKKFAACIPRLVSLQGFRNLFEVASQNGGLKNEINQM